MEPVEFISQEITVVRRESDGRLMSFAWGDRRYTVREVVAVWPDWGFSAGAPKRKNWRMRRHRTCYRVETTDGALYDLYHDRGIRGEVGVWILQSRIE